MQLALATCLLRPFEASDARSLARHANNRNIWISVRDRFPHPYRPLHAQQFIRMVRGRDPQSDFAIDVDGEAVGGISFMIQTDVQRVSAEIGYWLGEAHWGKGIATDAVAAITRYAIDTHRLTRLFGLVFDYNTASARVLEKCGYRFEARLPRSAIKDGKIIDQLQYGFSAPE
jgi:[ribosomal protein S5]-alanine N-acetyltransferase